MGRKRKSRIKLNAIGLFVFLVLALLYTSVVQEVFDEVTKDMPIIKVFIVLSVAIGIIIWYIGPDKILKFLD